MSSAERIKLIGACLLALVCFYFPLRGCARAVQNHLPPSDPKAVPLIARDELKRAISASGKPVFVFFYHSTNNEYTRAYFPLLNKEASRYQNKISFFRCLLKRDPSDPEFGKYSTYPATLVLFKEGQEIKQIPAAIPREPELAADLGTGLLYLLLKDAAGLENLAEKPDPSYSIKYVNEGNVREVISLSKDRVIVLYTSPTCPGSTSFQPQFESFAAQYRSRADFYLYDTASAQNQRTATPMMRFYSNGKQIQNFRGAFADSIYNEALIVGFLRRTESTSRPIPGRP